MSSGQHFSNRTNPYIFATFHFYTEQSISDQVLPFGSCFEKIYQYFDFNELPVYRIPPFVSRSLKNIIIFDSM